MNWVLLLVGAAMAAGAAAQFQTGPCANTPQCKCKWSEGKRMADCRNAGFNAIPTTLSDDIQTLILDKNSIRNLDKDVFKSVGLLNLRIISLRNCGIEYVDDNAFRDLKIMTSLDLSENNITKLFPKTFDGNDNLKTVKLSHNQITALDYYQFPPLSSLKSIDLSHCQIASVDKTAFKNLGSSVETVNLHNNLLTTMREEVFVTLSNLKALSLHSNPWVCDCRLKNFRDYVIHKRLYNRPTGCNEPSRLYQKQWDDISASEFACKPDITIPFSGRVFGARNVDATLACEVMGSPVPYVKWVIDGRIINNNSHPQPFADQTYYLHHEAITADGVRQWFNLTITNPDTKDLGKYLCVAENQGGVMEKEVTFTFDDPNTYYKPITDEQMTIIIGASVAVAVLFLLLLLVCCLCFCRGGRRKKSQSKSKNGSRNNVEHQQQQQHRSSHSHHTLNNGYSNGHDSQRLLPNGVNGATVISSSSANPLPKPQRMGDYTNVPQSEQYGGYIPTAHETEMQELRAPSVVSSGTKHSSSGNGSDGRPLTALSRSSYSHGHLVGEGSVASTSAGMQLPHYPMPPDLLVKLPPPNSVSPASTSNASSNGSSGSAANSAPMHTLNPAGLMMSPAQQQQFAHLMHHHQSPFTRSGTLPLPHQWPQQPRSVSCDHSAALSSSHFTPVSAVQQQTLGRQHNQAAAGGHHARPGYVTLPRRPRTGWSLPRDTPSPGGSSVSSAILREPIYDGVGPRTSADGSSRLNLNNSLPIQAVQPHQAHQVRLPPYCAPIEELAEGPPTPKKKPLLLEAHPAAHANGPPEPPEPPVSLLPPRKSDLQSQSTASIATSGSEVTLMEESLGAYCEPFGKALMPPTMNDDVIADDSVASNGFKSSTPMRSNGEQQDNKNHNGSVTSDLDTLRKQPPKTLPKPKVKPVPPPKPRKSFAMAGNSNDADDMDGSTAPLISFHDEGFDGSEV